MAVIVLQPRARADLSEIWEFIAEDSPDQADAFKIVRVLHGARDIDVAFPEPQSKD